MCACMFHAFLLPTKAAHASTSPETDCVEGLRNAKQHGNRLNGRNAARSVLAGAPPVAQGNVLLSEGIARSASDTPWDGGATLSLLLLAQGVQRSAFATISNKQLLFRFGGEAEG
eukprot:TRINITY_DN9600_c0_g1_i2.p2 TRINITY_DN9600_c0_g1~~TRINITY_DN9600_c0_g1_i2.p2  ORF type:complete len:115 (-),score=8.07 TRINITY_DN9600_c0_g1_i2:18-362(-)